MHCSVFIFQAKFYLLLLVSSSVPRLQNRLGFGAARGRHSIMTCPPLAAGISFLTGFNRKSGAWTGKTGGMKWSTKQQRVLINRWLMEEMQQERQMENRES